MTIFSKAPVNGSMGNIAFQKCLLIVILALIILYSNGVWDIQIKRVLDNGMEKVNQLHKIISNRNINLSAPKLLLLSVIRPSIECGIHNIVWN